MAGGLKSPRVQFHGMYVVRIKYLPLVQDLEYTHDEFAPYGTTVLIPTP